ncbi:MAG: YMGG-like glycine zipper-containing protein [Dongiaceae bacterium]
MAALVAGVVPAAVPAAAVAQQIYAYPTRGQSPEQQARDQQECSGWAAQQTGYNPAPPAGGGQPVAGGMLRGAAGGAAIGAVGGAIGGDAGKGAAIGAGAGALFGGIRQHQNNRSQAQQQAQDSQQSYDAYRRAVTACLQGRGYSVQ